MSVTYENLYAVTSQYIHSEESQALIRKAYDVAENLHEGQYRRGGEAYIVHPLSVAIILAELHVGPATICAGLLHDTVEDTAETKEDVAQTFGEDIASIVDGVTKLTQMKFASLEQKQAKNHQHMLFAMAKDIRVIVVKLADRLHNIRTLGALPVEKQERIAKETLEIYAPLAHKLGMFKIKAELEDTALK
ncbi:MAG: HD domain-containing protein, partial [Anaeroplasmataceae bacterium]|nr:HD domain-containing protein [Anaeroplasmataceae bacterium]